MPVPPGLLDIIAGQGQSNDAPPTESLSKAKGHAAKGSNAIFGGNSTATKNATAGTGLVTANPKMGDVEYLSPVRIGGQTLNLDFDSGSSDLWVFNTQLSAAANMGRTPFDPTRSQTFKMIQGASFSVSYGDGSGAAGNVGTDTVDIGGATVAAQAVELATSVSRSFVRDSSSNGLVGLAFSKLNTVKPQKQKTFFDNVMPSLAQPLFTADLRKNAVGAYEFGRIDTTKFTGSMAWIPINTTLGFWQFGTSKFAVGNGAAAEITPGQAIADTGTTLLLASPHTVSGYYSKVQCPGNPQVCAVDDPEVGGFTFPCNAQLPDLMLDVGGVYMARVKGADINFTQADTTGQSRSFIKHQSGRTGGC
jgi:hypothetical protein